MDEFAAFEATLASDEARSTIERVAWAICTDEREADYVLEETNHIYTPLEKTVWLLFGILLILRSAFVAIRVDVEIEVLVLNNETARLHGPLHVRAMHAAF